MTKRSIYAVLGLQENAQQHQDNRTHQGVEMSLYSVHQTIQENIILSASLAYLGMR